MHGRVWYEQRELSGSRFLFSFPLVETSPEQELKIGTASKAIELENGVAASNELPKEMSPILVVEDNAYAASEMILLICQY